MPKLWCQPSLSVKWSYLAQKRPSSWSLSTEKWAKVVHQQVKTRTKSNGNLHRKASFTEYLVSRLRNTWQLHISYLVCYNKWCNDNILCLTHWCCMKLELCINNALFTNMIHSLLDNQRSNTSRTNQNKHPSLVTTNRMDYLY